jgi:hypothetical protein
VRFARAVLVNLPAADRDSCRTLARRARCACAILRRRATADTIRVSRVPSRDSITEIARYLRITPLACALHEAAGAHYQDLPFVPLEIRQPLIVIGWNGLCSQVFPGLGANSCVEASSKRQQRA